MALQAIDEIFRDSCRYGKPVGLPVLCRTLSCKAQINDSCPLQTSSKIAGLSVN